MMYGLLPSRFLSKRKEIFLSGEVLVADAVAKRILFVPERDAFTDGHFPLSLVLGYSLGRIASRVIFDLFEKHKVPDEHLEWLLDRMPELFRNKRIIGTVMENASSQEALDAFLSICRAGQPMSDDDYERAKAWIESKDRLPPPPKA